LFGTISPDDATQLTLTVRDPLEGLDRRCRELCTPSVAKAESDERAISNTEQAIVTRINHSRQATRMIIAESGVEELNKLFRSVTKAKHRSGIIRYFQHKQREQIREDQ
jgi:hypothetical protein